MQLAQRQSVQTQIVFCVIAYLGYAGWKASQIESSHAPFLAGVAACFVACAFLAWVKGARIRSYSEWTGSLGILAFIGVMAFPKGIFNALSGVSLFGMWLIVAASCLRTQTENTAMPFPKRFLHAMRS